MKNGQSETGADIGVRSSVVQMHPRSSPGQSELAKFMRNASDRPLAIELDARRIKNLRQHSEDVGLLLQKEIRLWRQTLGPRRVHSLELHYFDEDIKPYQITGLIHCLASEFTQQKPLYRVVIQPNEAEVEVLALFKGLAFDHCQFTIEHADIDILDQLHDPFNAARSFQFQKIGVQLSHSEGVENLTQSIKKLRTHFNPDYIFIGSSTYRLGPTDIGLQQTLFEDDLRGHNLDFLCIGPQARSTFKGQHFDALNDARRYASAIMKGTLPIDQRAILRSL